MGLLFAGRHFLNHSIQILVYNIYTSNGEPLED